MKKILLGSAVLLSAAVVLATKDDKQHSEYAFAKSYNVINDTTPKKDTSKIYDLSSDTVPNKRDTSSYPKRDTISRVNQ